MRYADGGNFSIDIEHGLATLRVWQRPDLSFDEGARLATVILEHIRTLAAGSDARGFVMDLRDAPPLTGKKTRATLTEIVAVCEAGERRIAVLLAPGVQWVTMSSLLSQAGPTRARVFDEPGAAHAWLDAE